jgi:hypothetical protein
MPAPPVSGHSNSPTPGIAERLSLSRRVYLVLSPSPRVGQQRNRRNLRNVQPVQAVCEFVRIKSSHAFAAARSYPMSVRWIRVSLRQHSKSSSLRGWRSPDRGGSSPPFRISLALARSMRQPVSGTRPSRFALGRRHESPRPERACIPGESRGAPVLDSKCAPTERSRRFSHPLALAFPLSTCRNDPAVCEQVFFAVPSPGSIVQFQISRGGLGAV